MFLKANELRIGNYIEFEGKVSKVESIHKDCVFVEESRTGRKFDQINLINPIPITKE